MRDRLDLDREVTMDHIRAHLERGGTWRAGMIQVGCVVVVKTLWTPNARDVYNIHRFQPIGRMDPSAERGLLGDALDDARRERHPDLHL